VEVVFTVIIVWAVGYWIYRSGKREGSRKGYRVGRAHGRRRRSRRGLGSR
jgi:hypothetical protein